MIDGERDLLLLYSSKLLGALEFNDYSFEGLRHFRKQIKGVVLEMEKKLGRKRVFCGYCEQLLTIDEAGFVEGCPQCGAEGYEFRPDMVDSKYITQSL